MREIERSESRWSSKSDRRESIERCSLREFIKDKITPQVCSVEFPKWQKWGAFQMLSRRPWIYIKEKVIGDIAWERSLMLNFEDNFGKLQVPKSWMWSKWGWGHNNGTKHLRDLPLIKQCSPTILQGCHPLRRRETTYEEQFSWLVLQDCTNRVGG